MVTPAARAAAAGIRLLITDCDGVLTDAGIYYSAAGEELRRFSFRDGMGVERLRTEAGIPTLILTREDSGIVAARARKIGAEVILGSRDKLAAATGLVDARGLSLAEVAFIGDDVNDLALLRAVGLPACPADAEPTVAEAVLFTCTRPGGHGAFRELAEFIIAARAAHPAHFTALKENDRAVPAQLS